MKFASAKRLILQEEACKWGGRSKKYAAKVPFGAAGWVFQEIRIPKTNVSATPGPVSMTLGQASRAQGAASIVKDVFSPTKSTARGTKSA